MLWADEGMHYTPWQHAHRAVSRLLNDHAPTHHSGASPGTTQAILIALPALQFSLKALHTNFGAGTVGHMPLRLKGGDEHYKCIQRPPELSLLSRATCNRLHCVPGQGLSFVNACLSLWSDWQSQRGCAVARLSRAEAASVPCVTVPAATRISESMLWQFLSELRAGGLLIPPAKG